VSTRRSDFAVAANACRANATACRDRRGLFPRRQMQDEFSDAGSKLGNSGT
jgi:hypothetical protein